MPISITQELTTITLVPFVRITDGVTTTDCDNSQSYQIRNLNDASYAILQNGIMIFQDSFDNLLVPAGTPTQQIEAIQNFFFLIDSSGGGSGWLLDGNTEGAEKFFGTLDAFQIPFVTNSSERMRLKDDELGLTGNFNLPPTTSTVGLIKINGVTRLHFFGNNNIFFGANNFVNIGSHNYGIGFEALESNANGNGNVAIGKSAGFFNDNNKNVFIGYEAGYTNTGGYNVAIGDQAGYTGSGSHNIMLGQLAGGIDFGDNNVIIGKNAGYTGPSIQSNIFIGYDAGYGSGSGNGTHNVMIGRGSGHDIDSADYNTFIGDGTGYTNTSGNSNIYIGRYAGSNTDLGFGADTWGINTDNQMAIASRQFPVYDLYFNGKTIDTTRHITIHAAGGLGTDISGSNITIAGGQSTGNAASGVINFQTSTPGATGTTLRALATRVSINDTHTTISNTLEIQQALRRHTNIQDTATTLSNSSLSIQIVGGQLMAVASYVIFLPPSPTEGLIFTFKANENVGGLNTVTINGNLNTIDGNVTAVLITAYSTLRLVYSSSALAWYII